MPKAIFYLLKGDYTVLRTGCIGFGLQVTAREDLVSTARILVVICGQDNKPIPT